jgi:hypothetical protein
MAGRQVGIYESYSPSSPFIPHHHNADADGHFLFHDVRKWGALGDLVNDDSIPINAAVADIKATYNGGTLIIPPGQYLLKSPITLDEFINIKGFGRGAVILQADASLADYVFKISGTVGIKKTRFSVSDIYINGNNQASPLGGFSVAYCHGAFFERVIVYGFINAAAIAFDFSNVFNTYWNSCAAHLGTPGTPRGVAGWKLNFSDVAPTGLQWIDCMSQRQSKGFYFTGAPVGVNRNFSPVLINCGTSECDYGIEIDSKIEGFTHIGGNIEKGGTYAPTYGYYLHPGAAGDVKNVNIKGVLFFEDPTAIYANNVDGLDMDGNIFAGSGGGGGTVLAIQNTCTRVNFRDTNLFRNYYDSIGTDFRSVWRDPDFDNNEVLITGIKDTDDGFVTVSEKVGHVTAQYRIDGGTLVAISANAAFSTAKDTAGKYNVYFEANVLKVQNKVGDNKSVVIQVLRSL